MLCENAVQKINVNVPLNPSPQRITVQIQIPDICLIKTTEPKLTFFVGPASAWCSHTTMC